MGQMGVYLFLSMLCRASLARSVLRQAVRPYSSASPSLKELQDRYRTSASEILASIPHDGAEEEDENLEELYTQYYDNIGAQTNALIEKKKFQASNFYQELCDYYNAKVDRFDEPFYAATNFPHFERNVWKQAYFRGGFHGILGQFA